MVSRPSSRDQRSTRCPSTATTPSALPGASTRTKPSSTWPASSRASAPRATRTPGSARSPRSWRRRRTRPRAAGHLRPTGLSPGATASGRGGRRRRRRARLLRPQLPPPAVQVVAVRPRREVLRSWAVPAHLELQLRRRRRGHRRRPEPQPGPGGHGPDRLLPDGCLVLDDAAVAQQAVLPRRHHRPVDTRRR